MNEEELLDPEQHQQLIEDCANHKTLHNYLDFVARLTQPMPEQFFEVALSAIEFSGAVDPGLMQAFCRRVVLPPLAGRFFAALFMAVSVESFELFSLAAASVIQASPPLLKDLVKELSVEREALTLRFEVSKLAGSDLDRLGDYLEAVLELMIALDNQIQGISGTIMQQLILLLCSFDVLSGIIDGNTEFQQQQETMGVEELEQEGMCGSVTLSKQAMGSFKQKLIFEELQNGNLENGENINLNDENISNQQERLVISTFIRKCIDVSFCAILVFLENKQDDFLLNNLIGEYFQFIVYNQNLRFSQFIIFPALQNVVFHEELLKELFLKAFGDPNATFYIASSAASYLEGLVARSSCISVDFMNELVKVILEYVNAMDEEFDIEEAIERSSNKIIKCEYLIPGQERYLLGARCVSYIFCYEWELFNFDLLGDLFVGFLNNRNQPFRCFDEISEVLCNRLESSGIDDSIVSEELVGHDMVLFDQIFPFEPLSLPNAQHLIQPYFRDFNE